MPIEISSRRDGSCLYVEFRGVVSDEDYRSYMQELFGPRSSRGRPPCALVDWSLAEDFQVSEEALREGAQQRLRAFDLHSRNPAVAMVARDSWTYSLARSWEGSVDRAGMRTRAFENIEDAEAWLETQLERSSRWRPNLSLELEPPELEAEFRLVGLGRDRQVAMGLMLLSFIFHLLSFPTDLELLADSGALPFVWFVRVFGAVIAIAAFLMVRRESSVAYFDTVVFIWATLLMSGIAFANALLPADYITPVAWDLLLTLAAYAVVPLPLSRQAFIASIITVSDILLFAFHKTLDRPVALVDVIAALSCANLLGVFASWEFQRWRRGEFLAHRRELDVSVHLRRARMEITALKGIVPICMHCKNVRTDEGFWERVEDYVGTRSGVEFSHGLCPDCLNEHFPEAGKDSPEGD